MIDTQDTKEEYHPSSPDIEAEFSVHVQGVSPNLLNKNQKSRLVND